MAARANLNAQVALVSGAGAERRAACANHIHFVIGGMNPCFHFLGILSRNGWVQVDFNMQNPAGSLGGATQRGLFIQPYGYTLATLRATGRPVHRNFGLVTERKPERTNGDFKSRPPRAWIVCYSHYQNSFRLDHLLPQ